jgi:hypothetical protein
LSGTRGSFYEFITLKLHTKIRQIIQLERNFCAIRDALERKLDLSGRERNGLAFNKQQQQSSVVAQKYLSSAAAAAHPTPLGHRVFHTIIPLNTVSIYNFLLPTFDD